MKPASATLAVVLLLAALGGGSWWAARKPAEVPAAAMTATASLASPRAGAAATPPADSPQARAWSERQAFEAQARRFFKEAASLGPVQRSEQARALTASIDRYEGSGGLSAGEALLLRSGLVKATIADPVQQAERLADLIESYRGRSDQRLAAYEAQHASDPRFQDYKARERAIVAEVMALGEIPGGLTRDEYLRQRLQQARVSAYR